MPVADSSDEDFPYEGAPVPAPLPREADNDKEPPPYLYEVPPHGEPIQQPRPAD